MIKFSNKNIDFVSAGKVAIKKVYQGAVLVWETIAGCFTKGYWLNDKKWTNDRGWKNN